MEFEIIRNDIINMKVDAVVMPANTELKEGSGVSRAIFEKAGKKKLMDACKDALKKYKKIQIGDVIPTLGFNLDATYIIHAVVPKWKDGKHAEYALLSAAYLASLELSDEMGCLSLAFPLLSSGYNGFDLELAFKIAQESIESYMPKNKLQKVYLVIYDAKSMALVRELGYSVAEEIDTAYIFQHNEYNIYPSQNNLDKTKKWLIEYLRQPENQKKIIESGIAIVKCVADATKKRINKDEKDKQG